METNPIRLFPASAFHQEQAGREVLALGTVLKVDINTQPAVRDNKRAGNTVDRQPLKHRLMQLFGAKATLRAWLETAVQLGGSLPVPFDRFSSAFVTMSPDIYKFVLRDFNQTMALDAYHEPVYSARNLSRGFGLGVGFSYAR